MARSLSSTTPVLRLKASASQHNYTHTSTAFTPVLSAISVHRNLQQQSYNTSCNHFHPCRSPSQVLHLISKKHSQTQPSKVSLSICPFDTIASESGYVFPFILFLKLFLPYILSHLFHYSLLVLSQSVYLFLLSDYRCFSAACLVFPFFSVSFFRLFSSISRFVSQLYIFFLSTSCLFLSMDLIRDTRESCIFWFGVTNLVSVVCFSLFFV